MMQAIHVFWAYFRQSHPPLVRTVHSAVLVMVLMQMLSSNLIRFDAAGRVSASPLFFMGSWAHFGTGLVLALIGAFFVIIEIARRGLRYFFPYLWGDFSQLKANVKILLGRRLPEASPGSLAAVVQGLGLGALVLTLSSGLAWFFLWQTGTGAAETAKSIHEACTGLIQAYVVGHGGLGLIHIFLWNRNQRGSGQNGHQKEPAEKDDDSV